MKRWIIAACLVVGWGILPPTTTLAAEETYTETSIKHAIENDGRTFLNGHYTDTLYKHPDMVLGDMDTYGVASTSPNIPISIPASMFKVPVGKEIGDVFLYQREANGKQKTIKKLTFNKQKQVYEGTILPKQSSPTRLSAKSAVHEGAFYWWRDPRLTYWAFDLDGVRHWRKSLIGVTDTPPAQALYRNIPEGSTNLSTLAFYTQGNSGFGLSGLKARVFEDEVPNKGNYGWMSLWIPVDFTTIKDSFMDSLGIKGTSMAYGLTAERFKTMARNEAIKATVEYSPPPTGGYPKSAVGEALLEFNTADAINQGFNRIYYQVPALTTHYVDISTHLREIYYSTYWKVHYEMAYYLYLDGGIGYSLKDSLTPYLFRIPSDNVCYKDSKTIQMSGEFVVNHAGLVTDIADTSYLKFKSSDTSIATVTNKGLITFKKPGSVSITVTYHDNTEGKDYISDPITFVAGGDGESPCVPGGPVGNPPAIGDPPSTTPPTPSTPPISGGENGSTKVDIVYVPPTWDTGEIKWGLHVDSATTSGATPTQISAENKLPIGTHYAQNEAEYKISGVLSGTTDATTQATALDNKALTFKTEYTYTDHRVDTYSCQYHPSIYDKDGKYLGEDTSRCYYWGSPVSQEPDWSRQKTYVCTQTLQVNHRFGETIQADAQNGALIQSFPIGEVANVQASDGGCSLGGSTQYNEIIARNFDNSTIALETQTYVPLHQENYQWDAADVVFGAKPSVFPFAAVSVQGEVGVPDLDAAYKQNYANTSGFVSGAFSIPMNPVVSGYQLGLTSREDFALARSTGFTYPVAKNASQTERTQTMKAAYEAYTGETIDMDGHEVVYNIDGSRYYLPIEPNDEGNAHYMQPNISYNMVQGVRKLGLNNVNFVATQPFSFKTYLVGSVFDSETNVLAKVAEQKETPYEDIQYPYSVTINVKEAYNIYNATKDRGRYIFGYKLADTNKGYLAVDSVKKGAANRLTAPVPYIKSAKVENKRLKQAQ